MRLGNKHSKSASTKTSQSRTFTERRRRRLVWSVSLGAIGLICWCVALWAFINASWFDIRTVSVYGVDAPTAAIIKAGAEQQLSGSYLGLFSHASTLVYPHNAIAALAASSSIRIAGATVSREGLHGIGISLTTKTSSAIVCADLPDWNGATLSVEDASNCSFVDMSGRVFDTAPAFSGSAYNRYYIPSFDATKGVGAEFSTLQGFYDGIRRLGIEPLGMLIGDDGEYELYISNRAATSTVIVYLNKSEGLSDELSNLSVFWSSSSTMNGGRPPVFEYIDVRYAPNVFYRLSESASTSARQVSRTHTHS